MWREGTGGEGLSCPETKPSQTSRTKQNKTNTAYIAIIGTIVEVARIGGRVLR